jgi:hypothetical protein
MPKKSTETKVAKAVPKKKTEGGVKIPIKPTISKAEKKKIVTSKAKELKMAQKLVASKTKELEKAKKEATRKATVMDTPKKNKQKAEKEKLLERVDTMISQLETILSKKSNKKAAPASAE